MTAHAAHQTAIRLCNLRAEAARVAREIAVVEPTARNLKAAKDAEAAWTRAIGVEHAAYYAWLDS